MLDPERVTFVISILIGSICVVTLFLKDLKMRRLTGMIMWLLGLICILPCIHIIYVPNENWPGSSWAIGIAGLFSLLVGTLAWSSARKNHES